MSGHKKHYYIVDILRAGAAILVLNRHYESIYPIKLSIGAELGVAIFFIISGFLLSTINSDTKFLPWIIKRELRLFVPYYIWKIIRLLFHHITIDSFESFLHDFVLPTGIWFSIWISVLYIIYYLYVKYVYTKWGKTSIILLMGLSFCAFLAFYCTTEMHESTMKTSNMPSKMLWLFCMMLGFYIHNSIFLRSKKGERNFIICSIVLVLLYGISKIVISRGYIPYLKCIPTIISVITAPVIFIGLLNFEENHKKIVENISKNRIIQMISSSSLEIWYVSWFFIGLMSGIAFPLNWVCITVSIIIAAYILHKLSETVIKLCKK